METSKSILKQIPETNYYVSELGEIYIKKVNKNNKYNIPSEYYTYIKKKPYLNKHGYLGNVLQINGKKVYKDQHIWVWTTFNGPIQKPLQINHLSCDKTDNRLSNLEIISCKSNIDFYNLNRGLRLYEILLEKDSVLKRLKTHQEVKDFFGLKYRQHVISILKQSEYNGWKITLEEKKSYKD